MVKELTSFRHLPPQFRKRLDPSLERRRASRCPREKILIAGDQVTKSYFSGLIHYLKLSERVTLCHYQTQDPVVMVENTLLAFEKDGPFQRLFVLVYHDGKEKTAWHQAQALVAKHRLESNTVFRLITSVPSFDIWLLLHLVDTSLEYGNGSALATCVRNQLGRHLPMEEMAKDPKLFELLHPGLPDAIRRCQILSRLNNKLTATTPVTEVHELVTNLLKWQMRLQRLAD